MSECDRATAVFLNTYTLERTIAGVFKQEIESGGAFRDSFCAETLRLPALDDAVQVSFWELSRGQLMSDEQP
jgi:hypothetical protein